MSAALRLKNIVAAHAAVTKSAAVFRAEVTKAKPTAKVAAALEAFDAAVKEFDKVVKAPVDIGLDPVAPVYPDKK